MQKGCDNSLVSTTTTTTLPLDRAQHTRTQRRLSDHAVVGEQPELLSGMAVAMILYYTIVMIHITNIYPPSQNNLTLQ